VGNRVQRLKFLATVKNTALGWRQNAVHEFKERAFTRAAFTGYKRNFSGGYGDASVPDESAEHKVFSLEQFQSDALREKRRKSMSFFCYPTIIVAARAILIFYGCFSTKYPFESFLQIFKKVRWKAAENGLFSLKFG
jgi:hypothetical protein